MALADELKEGGQEQQAKKVTILTWTLCQSSITLIFSKLTFLKMMVRLGIIV